MSQSKMIADSNTYFRLAYNIHPFLFKEFGSKCHCLYILPELQDEYDRNSRLKSKFPWVDSDEYKENRSKKLTLSRKQRKEILLTKDLIWSYVISDLPGPSKIDVLILSYSYILEIPAITDDGDMQELANVFGVKTLTTLELLKLMLDCEYIDMKKIRQIVSYWGYISDFPKNYTTDYKNLFADSPPL